MPSSAYPCAPSAAERSPRRSPAKCSSPSTKTQPASPPSSYRRGSSPWPNAVPPTTGAAGTSKSAGPSKTLPNPRPLPPSIPSKTSSPSAKTSSPSTASASSSASPTACPAPRSPSKPVSPISRSKAIFSTPSSSFETPSLPALPTSPPHRSYPPMPDHPPQTTTSELDESLPSSLRPTQHCPPLALLRAHQEEVLPATLASDINRHIEQCPLCRMLLTDLEHIPQPAITTQERDRILRKLPHVSTTTPAGWRWYAAAAAACFLAIAGAFLYLRQPHVNHNNLATT